MKKEQLTLLAIFIWLIAGLWFVAKVADIGAGIRNPQPIDSVFIRQIDTLKQLEIRRHVLHDSVLVIKTKYDTIFKSIDAGGGFDTACGTTQRLVAMHRFIDSIAGE